LGPNNRWLFGFSKFVSTTSSSFRQPIHEKCGIEFVLLVATIMHGMKSHGVNFGCKIVPEQQSLRLLPHLLHSRMLAYVEI
jgi:hypothetical protein